MPFPIIDVHSHMLPLRVIKEYGMNIEQKGELYNIYYENRVIGPITRGFFDHRARIEELRKLEIDIQVLSVTHHLFLYKESPEKAHPLIRRQNEELSKICKEKGDKFICNGALPLQDPKASLQELDYIYSKLEMKGVEIGTNIAGKNLDSEELFPVYERIQQYDMPIFVHPNDVLGAERMRKYYLEIVMGTIAETSIAISSVIFGGVTEQFPKLKFIFCHGGGAIPYQIGRLKRAIEVREELKGGKVSIERAFNNLYFDTVLFYPLSIKFLIDVAGKDRIVLGTDYPFNMGDWDIVKRIRDLSLDEKVKEDVYYKNAKRIYKL
jgi:aminocarboxymuconate-semialdehyde decarboxylase